MKTTRIQERAMSAARVLQSHYDASFKEALLAVVERASNGKVKPVAVTRGFGGTTIFHMVLESQRGGLVIASLVRRIEVGEIELTSINRVVNKRRRFAVGLNGQPGRNTKGIFYSPGEFTL